MSKWVLFWDMHSGGSLQNPPYSEIYIEAPEEEAIPYFVDRFGCPYDVACPCCGENYSVMESESLEQASAFYRNCAYAYFRPDGTECPREEAWESGKDKTPGPGYTSKYVERPDHGYDPTNRLVPVEEYVARDDVLVIRADELNPAKGTA